MQKKMQKEATVVGIYRYQARNGKGELFTGELEAGDRHAAALSIRGRGLWVARLEEVREDVSWQVRVKEFLSRDLTGNGGVKQEQALLFLRQLAVLIRAGLPEQQAIKALAAAKPENAYQRMLADIHEHLLQGKTLAQAMSLYPQVFAENVRELVKAGETGGSLEEILARLSEFMGKSYAAQEKMKSIMAYPLIMGGISVGALVFMAVFVLPVFAGMLQALHTEMPWPTKLVLGLAAWLSTPAGLFSFVALLFTLLGGACWAWHEPVLRAKVDKARLHLPLLGTFWLAADWQQVLETLAILVESGIQMSVSLGMVEKVPLNRYLQACLEKAKDDVEHGRSLASAWQAEFGGCCPKVVQELVLAGEQAGNIEEMLQQAAEFCRIKSDSYAERICALADPAMTLVLGGIIFFIVLAVTLPLLNMIEAF